MSKNTDHAEELVALRDKLELSRNLYDELWSQATQYRVERDRAVFERDSFAGMLSHAADRVFELREELAQAKRRRWWQR